MVHHLCIKVRFTCDCYLAAILLPLVQHSKVAAIIIIYRAIAVERAQYLSIKCPTSSIGGIGGASVGYLL